MSAPRFPLSAQARRAATLCGAVVLCLAALLVATPVAETPVATTTVAATAVAPEARAQDVREVRALWVLRSSLTSADQITRLVRDARESGFNTLLVQVRGRGDAYFAQGIEPRSALLANMPPSFDPLALTLSAAHAAGLRVHAWININFVASVLTMPTDPEHIVHKHPEWLMLPRELATDLAGRDPHDPVYLGRLSSWTRAHASSVEGLYSSPIPLDAAHHVEAVITDLVERYPLDGVHMDYVRYPTADFDYSEAALNAFRESVQRELSAADRTRLDARLPREPLLYTEAYPERWQLYRRARLTDLVARIRTAVKQHRPQAMLTAAVKPDAREAFETRLQDWQDWAGRGLLDAVCPMAYTDNLSRFSHVVQGAARAATPQALWAGIGAYRLNPSETISHIHAARAAGAHGIALFSYDSLSGSELKTIGRAAFRDSSGSIASRPGAALASAR
jgi:uncharacterized lipoprotein YddW (UPF0748 family)